MIVLVCFLIGFRNLPYIKVFSLHRDDSGMRLSLNLGKSNKIMEDNFSAFAGLGNVSQIVFGFRFSKSCYFFGNKFAFVQTSTIFSILVNNCEKFDVLSNFILKLRILM